MARLLASLMLPALLVLQVGVASGHGTGLPWIWVEDEEVTPGQQFNVLVIDFEPYGTVTLELVAEGRRAALGEIASEGDGHGEAELRVPTDFPLGYVELTGTDASGGEAVTLLYVGELPAGVGPPAPAQRPDIGGGPQAASGEWWTDPSVLVLGLMLGGAAAGLLAMLARRRPAGATKPGPIPR
jgi:hypothetical protein